MEQEEFGAVANCGNGSVENLEFYFESPVRFFSKSGARNNMDSKVTKLEMSLSLVSLILEESQKSFQI